MHCPVNILNAVFDLYLYVSLAAKELLIFEESAHWLIQGADISTRANAL